MSQKQTEPNAKAIRSIIVVPTGNRASKVDNLMGKEETEIVAQIIVPSDDGWAWVVLAAAFVNVFILDGSVYTYGVLLPNISKSLAVQDSASATISSVQIGFYFLSSPISSALLNRFGFRTVGMVGGIVTGVSLCIASFAKNFATLVIFYGCFTGFGCSLVCMSSSLIVGFYFQKIRSIALAIVSCGSSVGIMILYPLNNMLVGMAGWSTTVLLLSGLHGIIYFSSLSFRPLPAVTISKLEEDGNPTRTVTYLPSTVRVPRQQSVKGNIPNAATIGPTTTQRIFGTVSNTYFPTAAAVVQEEGGPQQIQAGTSAAPASPKTRASRLVISAPAGVSQRQLKLVQSMVSRGNVQDARSAPPVQIDITVKHRKKRTCCGRLCHWESDSPESRPMYKDDVFYDGKIEKLPAYQKSRADVPEQDRTGLEYQMAVTRAVTVADIKDKRGVFTMAVRRVLASMMNPKLLKRNSFRLLVASATLSYSGALVPYIFLQDRNLRAGVDPVHCAYFVSAISFSNCIGKLILSSLTMKLDVVAIYSCALLLSGVMTMLSGISYTLVYQYAYSILFGFGISSITCLRSVTIVTIYGLEYLTNATGIVLMFIGLGNLCCTPLAAFAKDALGYEYVFYMSGAFITLGALMATPMRCFAKREDAAASV